MKFINSSYEQFVKASVNKKVIQFGASTAWKYYFSCFDGLEETVLKKTLFIVDNSEDKQNTDWSIYGSKFRVLPPEALVGIDESEVIVLITVSLAYQPQICEQLLQMNLPMETQCYSLPLMTYSVNRIDNSCVDEFFKVHKKNLLPKKIHCFWFSEEEKPELYKRCVGSWYKFCPDFEIVEWNSRNYDVGKNAYMREAFERRKWAFVSDYARLDVVNEYGGIYLDMDVELVAPIEKLLCSAGFFCRQEDGFLDLGSGYGACAGDEIVKAMLDTYSERRLILKDGSIDMTAQPEWLRKVFEKYKIAKCHDSQVIGERVILSNDYITCGACENDNSDVTLGIHWHNGGWLSEKDRKLICESRNKREELVKKFFYEKFPE